jgi:hypothetical protein
MKIFARKCFETGSATTHVVRLKVFRLKSEGKKWKFYSGNNAVTLDVMMTLFKGLLSVKEKHYKKPKNSRPD